MSDPRDVLGEAAIVLTDAQREALAWLEGPQNMKRDLDCPARSARTVLSSLRRYGLAAQTSGGWWRTHQGDKHLEAGK